MANLRPHAHRRRLVIIGAAIALVAGFAGQGAAATTGGATAHALAPRTGNADFLGVWGSYPGGWDILTQDAGGTCTGTSDFGYAMSDCQVTGDHYVFTLTTGDYHSYDDGTITGNNIVGEFTDTNGTHETYTAVRSSGGFNASFTIAPVTSVPGRYTFEDTTVDPTGAAMTETWTFGDGSGGTGAFLTHTYTKPGTYTVTLTDTDVNNLQAQATQQQKVTGPSLQESVQFLDGTGAVASSISPQLGDAVTARLTLSAGTDGVGSLHGFTFSGDPVTLTPTGVLTPTGTVPKIPSDLTLAAGGSRAFTYTYKAAAAGVFHLTSSVTALDDSGATVGPATGQASASVSSLLVTLTVTPSTVTQDEDLDGPKPVKVSVTEKIKNTTADPITNVVLRSLDASRQTPGQLLNITQTGGPKPDTIDGLPEPDLAPGQTLTLEPATFTSLDDGKIQFSSLVTGAGTANNTLRGYGTAILTINPEYLLKFTSHVVSPSAKLLPGGSVIKIQGEVTNLSDDASETLGPLFAGTDGNAGLQGLAYNDDGVAPTALTPPPALTLDPGQSKSFTLEVSTSYSDPTDTGSRTSDNNGGTRAELTFTPYGDATGSDGTQQKITPDLILSSDENLDHVVGIDQSIVLPPKEFWPIAAGMSAGAVQGVLNAASGIISGLATLVKLPVTSLNAAAAFESKVWNSYTDEEKDALLANVSDLVVAVLDKSSTMAGQNASDLWNQVNATARASLTKLANQWETGNSAEVARTYTEFSVNQIAGIAMPYALASMAKAANTTSVLERAQQAIQEANLPILSDLANIDTVQQVVSTLDDLKNGVELSAEQSELLYGITPDEIEAYQAIAQKYQLLITVRSRAYSSIKWISDYAAMLKPEVLKIKTVSPLDVQLGYPAQFEGSLIFQEPAPLVAWRAAGSEGRFGAYLDSFLQSKGFVPGTSEYAAAANRVMLRVTEWDKWSKSYFAWAKRGWIETTFNYKGNGVTAATRSAVGKYNGFKLVQIGDNSWEVQMLNPKTGTFVPVTGDIDAIAFTNLDGTPLTEAQHADVLDATAKQELLQAQHGESATYINGGVDFVISQFKPNEPGLQIAPTGAARVVRLNAGLSSWTNANDYNLVWDGGFVSAGEAPDVADAGYAAPDTSDAGDAAAAQLPSDAQPLPGAVPADVDAADGGPDNVGRCAVSYGTGSNALPLVMLASGVLGTVNSSGAVSNDTALTSTCLEAGPTVNVSVRPSTTTSTSTPAGISELPIDLDDSTSGEDPDNGFAVGDTVTIDPGGDDEETDTIDDFGSLIFAHPLRFAHAAGEPIVVTHLAPRAATAGDGSDPSANAGSDTDTTTSTGRATVHAPSTASGRRSPQESGSTPAPAPSATASPTVRASTAHDAGGLSDGWIATDAALVVATGGAVLWLAARRRRREDISKAA